MPAQSADPWTSVKEEVLASIKQARELLTRWQELASDIRPTSDFDEFEWATKELKKLLKSIGWDLIDLDETVDAIEENGNPAKFNLTAQDLRQRRDFTRTTKTECDAITAKLEDPAIAQKVASAKRGALMGGSSAASRYAKLDESVRKDNDSFIANQEQRQATVMKVQDDQLNDVSDTVAVLKTLGVAISNELDDQEELLEDFEADLDNTGERLKRVMVKLDRTLEISKDKKQTCCIVLLMLLMILMIVVYVSK